MGLESYHSKVKIATHSQLGNPQRECMRRWYTVELRISRHEDFANLGHRQFREF